MCGITGWVDFEQEVSHQVDVLKAMNEKLSPRGPMHKGHGYPDMLLWDIDV